MQTFLPYPDFEESAKALDTKRLGKQRVEAMQLLDALRIRQDWEPLAPAQIRNHPACLMWRNYETVLYYYGIKVCEVWRGQGHVDNVVHKLVRMRLPFGTARTPWWYGLKEYHKSHRISLLWKDFNFYKKIFCSTEEQDVAQSYLRTGRTFRTWWPTEHLQEKERGNS